MENHLTRFDLLCTGKEERSKQRRAGRRTVGHMQVAARARARLRVGPPRRRLRRRPCNRLEWLVLDGYIYGMYSPMGGHML